MNCPNCGTPLPDGAQFCHECGMRIEQAAEQPYVVEQPYVPGSNPSGYPGGNAGAYPGAPQPKRHTGVIIAVVIALVVLLIAAAVTVTTCTVMSTLRSGALDDTDGLTPHGPVVSDETTSSDSAPHATDPAMHPVTFLVSISNYNTSSSRIPVHITGTDDTGASVDKTIYLAYSGVDVELRKGTYHAEVAGSPISSDGTLYEIPDPIDFEVGSELEDGEPYKLPASTTLAFVPLDPHTLTDEQVEDALNWARRDEESTVDVDALEAAIKASRVDATA